MSQGLEKEDKIISNTKQCCEAKLRRAIESWRNTRQIDSEDYSISSVKICPSRCCAAIPEKPHDQVMKKSNQTWATLKAGMVERQNGGIMESWNGGKLPQILKDGITESRNGGKYPQILKDGMAERQKIPPNPKRRNERKSPQILKDRMMENHPKS